MANFRLTLSWINLNPRDKPGIGSMSATRVDMRWTLTGYNGTLQSLRAFLDRFDQFVRLVKLSVE